MDSQYKGKYSKYKTKYLELKKQFGGNETYFQAIRDCNIDKIRTYFEPKLDLFMHVDKTEYGNNTGLNIASGLGDKALPIVEYLISKGATIDAQSDTGISPLMNASGSKNSSLLVVQCLIRNKAKINLQDRQGISALMCATLKGDKSLPIVEYLVRVGADVNLLNRIHGETAILTATRSQYPSLLVVQFLVQQGANFRIEDKYGGTALGNASNCGKIEVIEYLLTIGADINYKNKKGDTVLIDVIDGAKQYNTEPQPSIDTLIRLGADVNLQNIAGETVLMKAVSYGNRPIIEFLIGNKAILDLHNINGHSALLLAKERGISGGDYKDILFLLVKEYTKYLYDGNDPTPYKKYDQLVGSIIAMSRTLSIIKLCQSKYVFFDPTTIRELVQNLLIDFKYDDKDKLITFIIDELYKKELELCKK
jgi:ankyrin repeat protein